MIPDWAKKSVFYHIFPMGFCDAPKQNDFTSPPVNRLNKVREWIPHMQELGVNAIYFSPLFQSTSHGYDTADYSIIDTRLGTNEDFASLCHDLKQAGFKIIIDGVFNHVGRDFFGFKDVLQNRENSPYKNWFNIDFRSNNEYNDGLSYEGWEGNNSLVKLNLQNPDVKNYLFKMVEQWHNQFKIDGLRLDVAYLLDVNFLKSFRLFYEKLNPECLILGEIIYGDYKIRVNPEMLHSCTNYELYKPIYSSLNEYNLFEISHSIIREFNENPWALYNNLTLYNFVDNHDVARIFTILKEKRHIYAAYTLLFTIPGIPSIYYGSEYGISGEKKYGDAELRPSLDINYLNSNGNQHLYTFVKKVIDIRKSNSVFLANNFRQVFLTNTLLCFVRFFGEEYIYVIINIADNNAILNISSHLSSGIDLLTGETIDCSGEIKVQPFEIKIVKKLT